MGNYLNNINKRRVLAALHSITEQKVAEVELKQTVNRIIGSPSPSTTALFIKNLSEGGFLVRIPSQYGKFSINVTDADIEALREPE